MATNKSNMKTIEQGRSKQAYQFVEDAYKEKGTWKEYVSGVKKLPILIKTNGLGQALAFIQHRHRRNFPGIYEQISRWLQADFKQLVPKGELVKIIVNMNSDEYRQVTIEVLALLNWMRRFVDGLEKEGGKVS